MEEMQGRVSKAIEVISYIAKAVLDLKTNKDQIVINIQDGHNIAPVIHTCTDSIATLGHVNSTTEQK